jgi:hypothetical protein
MVSYLEPSSGDVEPIAASSESERPGAEVAGLEEHPAVVDPNLDAKPHTAPIHRRTAAAAHVVSTGLVERCAFGFTCHWKRQVALPPILQALFGIKPKHNHLTRVADASASDLRRK